jgi:Na+-transporting NADH:ubiquinone oxidoreductase subunit NqrE
MSEMRSTEEIHQPVHVSTGAGIAIAGIWIASSAVTIVLLLIMFVLGNHSQDEQIKLSAWDAIVLFLVIGAPMIAAYNATKMILDKS